MLTIKLEKAIEILFDLLQTSSRDKSPDSWDALKLGIEALKLIDWIRGGGIPVDGFLLPGETDL